MTLSTVHRVKGLEWDHVVVFGADRGSMPHELSDDIEEERRVFHVALTRGRQTVTILVDEARPSRFLAELDGSAPVEAEAPPARRDLAPARIPSDAVFVEVGDEITIMGGQQGVVDEILTTGVLVKAAGTGATMQVPFGEKVGKAGVYGRLTPGGQSVDPGLMDKLKTWRLGAGPGPGRPRLRRVQRSDPGGAGRAPSRHRGGFAPSSWHRARQARGLRRPAPRPVG